MTSFFSKLFGKKQEAENPLPVEHLVQFGTLKLSIRTPEGYSFTQSQIYTTMAGEMQDVLRVNMPNGYDFSIYKGMIQLDRVFEKEYLEHRNKYSPGSITKIVERSDSCIIYEGLEGKIPFSSMLAQVEVNGTSFHFVTEEVHFDIDMKPCVITTSDCRILYQILRSIKPVV